MFCPLSCIMLIWSCETKLIQAYPGRLEVGGQVILCWQLEKQNIILTDNQTVMRYFCLLCMKYLFCERRSSRSWDREEVLVLIGGWVAQIAARVVSPPCVQGRSDCPWRRGKKVRRRTSTICLPRGGNSAVPGFVAFLSSGVLVPLEEMQCLRNVEE